MRSIKTYIDILCQKGLYYAFRETWRNLSPHSYTRCQLWYLREHYGQFIRFYPDAQSEVPSVIWVFWLQGIEDAPQLVQDCIRQMKKWAVGYDVRVVTAENMANYVEIPDYIMQKLKDGIITYTHFSDILRIFLLAKHGGIWMDSTVLLTGPIPAYVTEGPLFFFQSPRASGNLHAGSSWLIAAGPHHPVVENVVTLLSRYWERETTLRDYFLFHDFVTMVAQDSEQGRKAMQQMPYVSNVLPHTYTSDSFTAMPIHKLSYKHAIDYHLYIQ